jgi:hypothetical protein
MSATNAYGNVVLKRGNGASPEVFTAIAGIRSINGTKTEVAFNDSTTFDDTGGYRTFEPGLRDPGTLDLEIYFDPNAATYEALETDHDANPPTLATYRLEVLTGSQKKIRQFDAYVASISEAYEVDGFLQSSVSLRISGPIDRDFS